MKKMQKIRVFMVVLVLFVFSAAGAASAQTNSNAYISSVSGSLSSEGNGIVGINFSIFAKGTVDKVGVSVILLYTTEDDTIGNSDDELVKTYFYTDPLYTDQMMATNTYLKVSYIDYQGVEGQRYYAKLTFYSEKDGGFGTVAHTTKIHIA